MYPNFFKEKLIPNNFLKLSQDIRYSVGVPIEINGVRKDIFIDEKITVLESIFLKYEGLEDVNWLDVAEQFSTLILGQEQVKLDRQNINYIGVYVDELQSDGSQIQKCYQAPIGITMMFLAAFFHSQYDSYQDGFELESRAYAKNFWELLTEICMAYHQLVTFKNTEVNTATPPRYEIKDVEYYSKEWLKNSLSTNSRLSEDKAPKQHQVITLNDLKYNIDHFTRLGSQISSYQLWMFLLSRITYAPEYVASQLLTPVSDLLNTLDKSLSGIYDTGSKLFDEKYGKPLEKPRDDQFYGKMKETYRKNITDLLSQPLPKDTFKEAIYRVRKAESYLDQILLLTRREQLDCADISFKELAMSEEQTVRPS